jgi:hypothetical protein
MINAGSPTQESMLVELLRDIRQIFAETDLEVDENGNKKISSLSLALELIGKEERPWATYNRGREISQRQIAGLLNNLRIYPRTVRIEDKTPRGYVESQFREAFDSNLTPYSKDDPQQQNADNEINELTPKIDPQQSDDVADRKSDLSNGKDNQCFFVADHNSESSLDADGFDWSPNADHQPEPVTDTKLEPVRRERIRYLDANLNYRWADSSEDAWKQIKAEHAARRKREKGNH